MRRASSANPRAFNDTPYHTTFRSDAYLLPALFFLLPVLTRLLALFLFLTAIGCTSPTPPAATGTMSPNRTLFANLRAAEDLTVFTEALGAVGLAETLSGPGPYTVFAPTDAAFATLSEDLRAALTQRGNPVRANLLAYHLAPTRLAADDFDGEVRSINGAPLYLALDDSTATVNRQQLVRRDIPARNGVLHVIDVVLRPPGMQD